MCAGAGARGHRGRADPLLLARTTRPTCCCACAAPARRKLLLLGHLDTVVAHAAHRPMEQADGRYTGSGTIDMKGGDVLALGVHARAGRAAGATSAEVALLLVCDEEWRQAPFAHAARFAGWDACLCFEAGERAPDGGDAVIVRRKAAGTLRVTARGRASHAGASPEKGRNALLALAEVARHAGRPARARRARPPDRGAHRPDQRRRAERGAGRRRADLRRPRRRAGADRGADRLGARRARGRAS